MSYRPPIKTGVTVEGLVFYIWAKFYRPFLELQSDMVQDLQQELRVIALEVDRLDGELLGYSSLGGLIQSKIYRFLINYGFKRPRGSKIYISSTTLLQTVADSLE